MQVFVATPIRYMSKEIRPGYCVMVVGLTTCGNLDRFMYH